MHTLATVGALQALNDMETYHEHGWYPSVNVKCHVWVDDIPWQELEGEFGAEHVALVREWAKTLVDSAEYDQLDAAVEIAREDWWDDAQMIADDIWGQDRAKVYSAGRSGGHLIVMGFGEPNDWTTETCSHIEAGAECCYDWDCEGFDIPDVPLVLEWLDFAQNIEAMRDGFPYQVGWHLIANVHDPIHDMTGAL